MPGGTARVLVTTPTGAGMDPIINVERVALRVARGGHDVPRSDVMRRFKRGWTNFLNVYQPLADHWAIYENSESKPRLLERGP